jgi:hypothetical protein
MSEIQREQDDDPLNEDSIQQLYNDWLQKCFLTTNNNKNNNNNVKEEAKVAFRLFTISNCNMDEKLALLITRVKN